MNKKKTLIYLCILLLTFGIFSFLLPISGDDYGCYIAVYGNLYKSIILAKEMYYSWEGRFIGRIIILVLSYYKYFFNIITTLLIGYLFIIVIKSIKNIKNSTYILLIFAIFALNVDMFSQCYTWVAGTVTYLYPSVFILLYFIYIYLNKNKNISFLGYILFIILNVCLPMFVENIACSLVFGNLLLCIYFYKNKKNNFYKFLSLLIISSISLYIMMISSGSAIRSASYEYFNNLSLFRKIFLNLDNISNYLFNKNIMMILLMLIIINYALKLKNIKTYKLVLFNVIPVLSIINNIKYYISYEINFMLPTFFDYLNKYIIFFWLIFFIIYLYSIYIILNNNKDKMMFCYYLIIISLIATCVMLIVPSWGDRVTFFTVITISIVSIIVINEFINDNLYKYLIMLLSFAIIYFIFCGFMIYRINKYRLIEINKQVNKDIKEVKVLYNPMKYLWNNNIPLEYFVNTYKKYLGLDDNISFEVYRLRRNEYFDIVFKK